MNIILFSNEELQEGILAIDFRAVHILKVLKLSVNDTFSAGIFNKEKGIATLLKTGVRLFFSFEPKGKAFPLAPITLICGLPRPPVARRILKDAVTAGVQTIHFVSVENGEKSYAQSKLWTSDDYKTAMLEGAMQGGSVYFPELFHWQSVSHFFKKNSFDGDRLILDNPTGAIALSDHVENNKSTKETVLAIGAERGWTDNERKLFAVNGFVPITLGPRILRTETAITASILITQNIKKI